MAALKEGSGTVPGGYAKLRGEHQGDLADITSSDNAVGAVCLTWVYRSTLSLTGAAICAWYSLLCPFQFFFVISFYLQSVLVHVKTCIQWHVEECSLALLCN
jgi:hypothetical protein